MTTINVYPLLGTTYPAEGGGTITAAGLTVDLSNYYRTALASGYLVTTDPTATSDGTAYVPSSGDLTVLNVRSYGAVGDGWTDDHPAIQEAVIAAQVLGGRDVYLPGGNYYVSEPIVVSDNVNIRGDGQKLTYVSGAGSSPTGYSLFNIVTSASAGIFYTRLSGFTAQLCKNGIEISGDGVVGAGDTVLDVDFYACNNAGLYIHGNATGCSFRNLRASGCNYGVYANGPTVCNYASFSQCFFTYTSIAHMYFGDDTAIDTGAGGGGGQQGIKLRDILFDATFGHGLQVFASTVSCYDCYFESCGMTSGYDVLVESNWTVAHPTNVPTYAHLHSCVFDIPGAGQLVSGTYLGANSTYNRLKPAMPGADIMAYDCKVLNQSYVTLVDNSSGGFRANVSLKDSPFKIVTSPTDNYLPYAQRSQPGYIGMGVITTYATATTIGVASNMSNFGGACLVMTTQDQKAGLYFLRLADVAGVGFLKTLVTGDDIADFSVVSGVVCAVAKNAAQMHVSVLSSHIGTGVFTGF